ncbi:unnamed protein product [Anisakis simplex]|uniref:Toxin_TOLIP domain-containing protein n=1 Tax=Anisakis simplex TaxID=6269 RepID=A0A0M3J1D3_ANISI|nr:unnamed protein product [Anisakis simplex]
MLIGSSNCLIFISFVLIWYADLLYGKLSVSDLKALCAHEKPYCIQKAVNGECYGSSLKSQTLKKTCRCSCDAMHHERIQTCCRTVGRRGMGFCLPLCGYNTTADEVHTIFEQ